MTRASAAGAASNHNHGRAPSGSLGHGHLEAQQPSRLFEEVRVAILEAREEQTQRQAEVNGDEDGEGGDGEASRLMATIETTPVYPLLQLIRGDVRLTIDTGLTWEELTGHELNFAVVRPLARKYSKLHSPAILYAFLVTRIYFLREADRDLAYQSVNQARASLCEILAIKLLRTFASDGLDLVTALSAPFWPFAGADEDVMSNVHRRGYAEKDPLNESTSTLQLAIYSTAKKFIATPLVQKCVDGIYSGKVVLSNSSAAGHAIIDDSYKKRPVCFYDPATAPFLDHRRLRVPRVRSWLEAANFVAILAAYIVCLGSEGTHDWTAAETIFIIWLIGLAIDELAQVKEHGWSVYVGSLFNVLDSVFCVIGFTWFGIRLAGLITGKAEHTEFAFNVLSLGAILLCPRMASLLVSDNVLLLALRAMVVEFSYFLGLALVFFSGFLWTFWSLSDSSKWTPATIGWLMLRFTFGNTISLEQAQEFSPTFGPWLVVAFTILAQTLLLTILISLLSATFSRVAAHAQEESLFQHSYSTLQGVSSEALFSYFPPLNILCLLIVLPATFFCSPRWVHKVNVFIIRLTHLPILLTIRLLERHDYWTRGVELAAAETKKGLRGHLIERLTTKRRTQFDIIEVAFSEIVAEGEERGDRGREGSTAAKDSNPSSCDSQYQRRQTQAQDQQQQTSQDSGPKDTVRDHRQLERVVTTDSVKSNRSYPDSPGATIRRARDAFAAVSGKGGNGGRVVIVDAGNAGSGGGGQSTGVDLIRQDTFASLFSPSRPQRKGGIRRARTQSPSLRPPQEEGEEDGEGDEDKPAKRRGLWSKRKAAKQAEAGAEADTSASSQRRKEQLNLDDSVERKDYAENEQREDDGDEEPSDDDDENEAGSVGSEDEDSGPSNAAWGDVMLRFLERLDEQAQTTDRIEEMLNRIVASKEGGELSDEKPGDQAGEGGK